MTKYPQMTQPWTTCIPKSVHVLLHRCSPILDQRYLQHVKIKDKELPFLPMLDEVMYAEKKMLFYKLIQKFDPKKTSSAIAFIFTEPISAMHNPDANTISKWIKIEFSNARYKGVYVY